MKMLALASLLFLSLIIFAGSANAYDCSVTGTGGAINGYSNQIVCEVQGATDPSTVYSCNKCQGGYWMPVGNYYCSSYLSKASCNPYTSYNSLADAQNACCPQGNSPSTCKRQMEACSLSSPCCSGLTCKDTSAYGKVCMYPNTGCTSDNECIYPRKCIGSLCVSAWACDYLSPTQFRCNDPNYATNQKTYTYSCSRVTQLSGARYYASLSEAKSAFCPGQNVLLYDGQNDGQGTPTAGGQLDSCSIFNPCAPGLTCQDSPNGKVCVFIQEDTGMQTGCTGDSQCLKNADGTQRKCVDNTCQSGKEDSPCDADEDCQSGYRCEGLLDPSLSPDSLAKSCQKQSFSDRFGKYMIFVVLVPAGALIGYIFGKSKPWAALGGIAGLVAAYLIYWIVTLPWYVKVLGAAGGGILMYLFGGTILTGAILLIGAFRKR